VLFDLFVNVAKFAGFRELAKSGVIAVQQFTLFLFCLSKIVHFVGGIDLWREIFVHFCDCCVIIIVFSSIWLSVEYFIYVWTKPFFPSGPALPSARTSNDGKFCNETAMRFDRVEHVATAHAYHENFLQVFREFFNEKPVLL